jgi:hypothetical protein
MAFDAYGDIPLEDEKARLDNFAFQLMTWKESGGAILAFAGRKTYENEAAERLKRAKDYLVKVRKIDPNRLTTIDSGYREEFQMYFWVVPPGVALPSLESDISPTEIELTKRRPKVFVKKRR